MRLRAVAVATLIIFPDAPAVHAQETITYTYDALGRLVKVSHSGTASGGVITSYTYDKADNRTNVTVTGAVSGGDGSGDGGSGSENPGGGSTGGGSSGGGSGGSATSAYVVSPVAGFAMVPVSQP